MFRLRSVEQAWLPSGPARPSGVLVSAENLYAGPAFGTGVLLKKIWNRFSALVLRQSATVENSNVMPGLKFEIDVGFLERARFILIKDHSFVKKEFGPFPASCRRNPRSDFERGSSLGAAIRPDILLNNEKVGEATSWGFFYADRPSGDYTVVTSTEVTRKCSFTLDKGQTRYIRMAISMGFFVGHVYSELVDEPAALKELKGCRYIGK